MSCKSHLHIIIVCVWGGGQRIGCPRDPVHREILGGSMVAGL
jgi:hypothetical protein